VEHVAATDNSCQPEISTRRPSKTRETKSPQAPSGLRAMPSRPAGRAALETAWVRGRRRVDPVEDASRRSRPPPPPPASLEKLAAASGAEASDPGPAVGRWDLAAGSARARPPAASGRPATCRSWTLTGRPAGGLARARCPRASGWSHPEADADADGARGIVIVGGEAAKASLSLSDSSWVVVSSKFRCCCH
jgi:hypothetical protein